jgi:hypothetical protein
MARRRRRRNGQTKIDNNVQKQNNFFSPLVKRNFDQFEVITITIRVGNS